MSCTLRRLAVSGLGALALFWATRSGVARVTTVAGQDAQQPAAAERVQADDSPKMEIKVLKGRARIVHALSDISRSYIADPQVADLVPFGPKEYGIQGLECGTTTVTFWFAGQEKPVTAVVRIEEEPAETEVSTAASSDEPVATAAEIHDDPAVTAASFQTAAALASVGPGLPIGENTNYAQQLPAISIETSCPIVTNVNKPAEQQILLKNVGAAAAEQVEVRAVYSEDSALISTEPKAEVISSTLVWKLGRIEAGGEKKLTVKLKPLVAGELSCNTTVSFASTATVKMQVRQPKLKLVCEGPSDVIVGSDVHLMMTVANTGTGTAEGVRIRQITPNVVATSNGSRARPVTIEVGTLEPGESRVVETGAVAKEPGVVRVALVAEAEDAVTAKTEHQIRIRAPKLSVSESGPDFRPLSGKATYQVAAQNPGDAAAENVHILVGLPEGLEYVEASGPAIYNPDQRTVGWTIGSLDAGEKREFSMTVLAKTEGEHVQKVAAWADGDLIAKSEKITRVEGTTSIDLKVSEYKDPVAIGGEMSYQIEISNRGTKAAEQVQIVATVPEGLEIVGVNGPIGYHVQGQTVTFDTIPAVRAQSEISLLVELKGVQPGRQRFIAELNSPTIRKPIIAERITTIYGE